jgi:hypothetical protein
MRHIADDGFGWVSVRPLSGAPTGNQTFNPRPVSDDLARWLERPQRVDIDAVSCKARM